MQKALDFEAPGGKQRHGGHDRCFQELRLDATVLSVATEATVEEQSEVAGRGSAKVGSREVI